MISPVSVAGPRSAVLKPHFAGKQQPLQDDEAIIRVAYDAEGLPDAGHLIMNVTFQLMMNHGHHGAIYGSLEPTKNGDVLTLHVDRKAQEAAIRLLRENKLTILSTEPEMDLPSAAPLLKKSASTEKRHWYTGILEFFEKWRV